MIKKLFTFILALLLMTGTLLSSTYAAEQEFTLTDKKGTLEVTKDSIFVGTVEKNTSIIDLFKGLTIDGKTVIEDTLSVLDVRYVTPDKVDFKISTDTDIIDKGSDVYVLFKSTDDGGLILNNSTIDFELKNFKFTEIGIVSDLEDNSYTKVYDVIYLKSNTNEEEVIEEVILDNTILEENNTGIKDNIILIILGLVVILGLFAFPNKVSLKINTK